MISCLQLYLSKGLVKSKFVNLKIRQLSAETSHDFIEWCGIINGTTENEKLEIDRRISLQDCYFDFIEQYPDYGPKAKLTISRIKFNKWIYSFAVYKTGLSPEEGRDGTGRWIRIKRKEENKIYIYQLFEDYQILRLVLILKRLNY